MNGQKNKKKNFQLYKSKQLGNKAKSLQNYTAADKNNTKFWYMSVAAYI